MGKTVFAFDVGLASLGVAVNKDNDIKEAKSLLIHATAGCIKSQAVRRGAYRRKRSHKEREKILESFWLKNVGKEGFLQRKSFKKENGKWIKQTEADVRLEKEFPGKDEDDITYASSLLRIQLLEGKKLEKWQIYKALHASIQRRGYDKNVPWKDQEAENKRKKKNDTSEVDKSPEEAKKKNGTPKDKDPEEEADNFEKDIQEKIKDKKYHYPCYFDAYQMGLWDNERGIIAIRQNESNIKGKSDYTAPREYVEKELADLLKAASKQIPQLKPHVEGDNLTYLLYGKKEENSLSDKYPSEKKIDGLLAQKYPRFNNRIVSKCCLIRRLNVCKSSKKLAIEVGFLLRLCNFRYETITESGSKEVAQLSREKIREIFKECETDWNKKNQKKYDAKEYAKYFKRTKTKIEKFVKEVDDNNRLKIGHTEIEASKTDGRSRYSQPTLYILKKLILSDQEPRELYEALQEKINTEKKTEEEKEKNLQSEFGYKLFPEAPYRYKEGDFWFLKEMDNEIYIPDMPLAQQYGCNINQVEGSNEADDIVEGAKDAAIQRVIKTCNWPVVRHRLNVFYQELKNLVKDHGKPDAIHIEFVREDFMSDKKKTKYKQQSREGQKNHQEALKKLNAIPTYSNRIPPNDIKKYRLFEDQNRQCLYTGEQLRQEDLPIYEIDHIFPKKSGGPDAFYNIVLTTRNTNEKKGKQLPCECDFIDWNSYHTRVMSNKKIDKQKKSILLASDIDEAMELIEKYTALHATSYIARLARDIACLTFDWQPGAKGEKQKIFVSSGTITSRITKKYKLHKVLGSGKFPYEKDREDNRHHALDAMIISYLKQYTRDEDKAKFFELPKGKDNYEYFSEKLKEVYPYYITHKKPILTEEPYQVWDTKKFKEITEKRKKIKKEDKRETRKLADKKEAKNLSKDPDERGQWYLSKKAEEKSATLHGYLFYFDKESDKLKHKAVHSFNSPYQIEKMLERQGHKIHGMFYSKQFIQIQPKEEISATRLGRNLPFIEYGIYKIERLNKKAPILCNSENEKIKIKSKYLYKINLINNLLEGQTFSLKEYPIKTKDNEEEKLTGNFQIENFLNRKGPASIVNLNNGEEYPIDFDNLIRYLDNDDNELSKTIKKNDLIQLGEPYIKDGTYTIAKTNDIYLLKNGADSKDIKLKLPNLVKLKLIDKHIVKKEPFELDNYPTNEEKQLTGSFKLSKLSQDKDSAVIVNSNNDTHPVDLKCLIIELCKNQTKQKARTFVRRKHNHH